MIHPSAKIHPTALVADGAVIGEDVVIGPFCIIEGSVEIKARTVLNSHIVVKGDTVIGEDNQIYQFASIGEVNQDLKYKGEATKTIIGNGNRIREHVTIHRGTIQGGGVTRIGNNNLLMVNVHVAHDCQIKNNCILANNATLAGHVIVEDRAVIGGLSAVHQFCKIGRNAMIGGMARVTQDVPPFMICAGDPAFVSGLNSVGLSRAGMPVEERSELKKAFRILYRSGLPLQEAISTMEQELTSSEPMEHLMRFLRNVERGIIRTRRG